MNRIPRSVPRPLIRLNQSVIVATVVLNWLTGWHWLLALPLTAGLLGLLFDYNPVIRWGARFLKKERSHYVQEDYEQQRFNQTLAVLFLAGGLFSYLLGWTAAAIAFTVGVTAAATAALLGFCIGCFIHYRWMLYRHKQRSKGGIS